MAVLFEYLLVSNCFFILVSVICSQSSPFTDLMMAVAVDTSVFFFFYCFCQLLLPYQRKHLDTAGT